MNISSLRRGLGNIFRIVSLLLVFWTLTVSIFSAYPAMACTPTATPPGFAGFPIADYTNAAQIVLEGTIIAISQYEVERADYPRLGNDEASIEVQQYFKGDGPATINIRGFGPITLCLIEAQVNARRIFYASIDLQGVIWILEVDTVNPDTITQILQVSGQLPVTPSTETVVSANPSENYSLMWWCRAGILATVLIVTIILFTKKIRGSRESA